MAKQSITYIWQQNAASGFSVKIPDDRSLVARHPEFAAEWYPWQDDLKGSYLNACSQVVMGRQRVAINWEPSEFDRAFMVSGTLSVTTSSGHRTLGYPKPVSVSADNRRDAKAKVRAMLLAGDGLSEANVVEDMLEVANQISRGKSFAISGHKIWQEQPDSSVVRRARSFILAHSDSTLRRNELESRTSPQRQAGSRLSCTRGGKTRICCYITASLNQ